MTDPATDSAARATRRTARGRRRAAARRRWAGWFALRRPVSPALSVAAGRRLRGSLVSPPGGSSRCGPQREPHRRSHDARPARPRRLADSTNCGPTVRADPQHAGDAAARDTRVRVGAGGRRAAGSSGRLLSAVQCLSGPVVMFGRNIPLAALLPLDDLLLWIGRAAER